MKTWLRNSNIFCSLALLFAATSCGSTHRAQNDPPSKLERVVVSGQGFVLAKSGRPFHPWGLNYGSHGRLIEDFWDKDWATLDKDFRNMKALGANVVRVHLQFGKFMDAPARPNAHQLKQFQRLLRLAEKTGLYLDITGLGCYRPSDVPAQYDAMDEEQRWSSQAEFWLAIAKAGHDSPAIFCYDLMNEPFVPGPRREPGQWRSGTLMGSGKNAYDFVQFISLDAAGRTREDLARQWVGFLTGVIRQQDARVLVTVGQLPWSRQWHHLSGFDPAKIKNEIDFLSVHIYPDSKLPDEAMECLKQFAVGKPVVVEETFPLSCGVPQEEAFLQASRAVATGWMGHYDGDSLAELDALEAKHKISKPQALYRAWLQVFVKLGPEFKGS